MSPSGRNLALVALLLGLVLAALWSLRGGARREDRPEETRPSPEEPATAELELEPPAPAPLVDSAVPTRTAEETVAATQPAAPACVVFGLAVDEAARPLAGVPVRLYGYKRWADGHDVPRLPGKYDFRGWEVITDASGAFRFEGPVPTVAPVQLRLTPDPFHDSEWVRFGGEDTRTRPPLHAGPNDLGTFVLVATGAIRGRVTARDGEPLAGAELRIADSPSTTFEREGESDASGSYVIAHVKPGTYGVAVDLAGYLSRFETPFLVEHGRFTDGVDFVLDAAPTLRGAVVDEEGRGLAGAKLWGWPSTSGRGAGGRSAADGTFTIALPQDEPYTLEVELEGYDSFGLDDRSTHYSPGTHDLRIVLARSADARTLFRVVDAATGAPIERFGLEVERDRGSGAVRSGWTSYRANPRPEEHSGGELETAARPALDRVTVCSSGYLPAQLDVLHDDGPGRQRIALLAGGTLTGRVLDGGAPAVGIAVELRPGRMDGDRGSGERFEPDLDTLFQTTTDDAGCFRFDVLEEGTYRVLARAASGRCAARVPLEMGGRGNVDAGTLELAPGAAILGRVLVPPGRPMAGLQVYLQPWQLDVKRTTDAEGRFRFDGLLAGEHSLLLDAVPGVLASVESSVELAAGEERAVEIDARAAGTCTVTLGIEVAGEPAAGAKVDLRSATDPEARHELGETDAAGRVSGWAPVLGDVQVHVRLPGGEELVHPEPLELPAIDARVAADLRFEVGALVVELPAEVVLPEAGSLVLTLAPAGSASRDIVRRLGIPPGSWRSGLVLEGHTLSCAHVPPGEYELRVDLHDPARAVAAGTARAVPVQALSRRVTIRERAETRVD